MLKTIICDDDEQDLELMTELMERYLSRHDEQMLSVDKTTSATELRARLNDGERYDLYILDIMMKEQDGISLGKAIRECNPHCAIVYVTSSPEYALGAFGVYASGYLLKPVQESDFAECMNRILYQLKPKEENIYTFKSRDGIVNIELSRLIRVENVSRVMHFYMDDGEEFESVYIRKPFEQQLEQLLSDSRFIQPHKSFIINMEQVEKVMTHDFMMSDGVVVPISRNNLTLAKKHYLEYLSKSDWK